MPFKIVNILINKKWKLKSNKNTNSSIIEN